MSCVDLIELFLLIQMFILACAGYALDRYSYRPGVTTYSDE